MFVIRAFAIGHADALEASFDSPLRDKIIFLWLTVEGVDSQIDDNYRKQQKLIHKIPLSPNVNLFWRTSFFLINDGSVRAHVSIVFDNCFSFTCLNSQRKRYPPSRWLLRPSPSRCATGPWRRRCPPQVLQRLSPPRQGQIDFASSRLRPLREEEAHL